jgi:hypothetical protein
MLKVPIQREMNNMRVRKLSLEMLGWSRDESRFALEGRLVFAQVQLVPCSATISAKAGHMTSHALLWRAD